MARKAGRYQSILSDDDLSAALSSGMTDSAIARKYGISTSAVAQRRKKIGIKTNGKGNVTMAARKKKTSEETRVVPWLPGYSVSIDGTVYSERGNEPYAMTPKETDAGKKLTLSLDHLRYIYVAVVVCEAWHGPRPEGHVVGYRDGDRNNCAADNLYWTPPKNYVTPGEFVRAWQSSSSTREVSERTGSSLGSVYQRATLMRSKGVPLKEMRAKFEDWESLAKLAAELADQEEA